MNFQKFIRENAGLLLATLGLLIVGVIAFTVFSGGGSGPDDVAPAYYSSDDGQSFFIGYGEVAPFEHDGREAVSAVVYRDRVTGEEFVGYLTKMATEEDRQKLLGAIAEKSPGSLARVKVNALVKRPGQGEWVPYEGKPGAEVRDVTQSPAGNAVISLVP